ncbi:MAG: hypothetical protein QGH60_19285 [Phycisphaerae bacterium]|nr:hypothetical protein [Phycisphaerae bacterium]
MSRRFGYIAQIATLAFCILLWFVYSSGDRPFFVYLTIPVFVAIGVGWLLTFEGRRRGEVPKSAVLAMFVACKSDETDEQWITVRFPPKASSLSKMKLRLQMNDEDALLDYVMSLFDIFVQKEPQTVAYFSPGIGVLTCRRDDILRLLEKYGEYNLDEWYALLGAIRRNGGDRCNLDKIEIR